MENTSRIRLLVVEDEVTDAMLIRKALKSHAGDANIELAHSGAEALEYLMGSMPPIAGNTMALPQLILMDLKLPGIGGFETLERIKSTAHLKEIPTVMLTSSSDPKDVRRAFAIGANSYLVKPNTFADLLTLASNVVHYWLSLNERPAG